MLGVREHAVPHDAQLARSSRSATSRSLRCMFTGGEAVPYERAARFEDVTGARVLAVLRLQRDRRAEPHRPCVDDREHRLQHRGPGHPGDERAPARRRRSRHHRARRPRQPGVQGPGHLLRLPRRRRRQRRAVHRRRLHAHRRPRARSTPTATSASSAARPTSSSAAARTSARRRSRPRSRSHPGDRGRRGRRDARRDLRRARAASTWSCNPAPRVELDDVDRVPRRARRLAANGSPSGSWCVDALPRASGGKVAKGELRADRPIRRRQQTCRPQLTQVGSRNEPVEAHARCRRASARARRAARPTSRPGSTATSTASRR